MKSYLSYCIFLCAMSATAQMTFVRDSISKEPVSFATISFGDGRGNFAGEEGEFLFSKKRYADIDSLFISAIGYRDKGIATDNLPSQILLAPEASQLSEVVLTAEKRGKFKKKKIKHETHEDYFSSWLPTVESEVAVYFPREGEKSTKISKLYIPVFVEKTYKKKEKMKNATFFKITFYANDNGLPGKAINYGDIVFHLKKEHKEVIELDLDRFGVFIPKEGIYASLQVMGYADDQGKLIQTKKYNEIKTRRGIQKVSITFRPLLPFISGSASQKTFVRRVFLNNKKWQIFDQSYNENSNLIKAGKRNYGMGALLHVYQDE